MIEINTASSNEPTATDTSEAVLNMEVMIVKATRSNMIKIINAMIIIPIRFILLIVYFGFDFTNIHECKIKKIKSFFRRTTKTENPGYYDHRGYCCRSKKSKKVFYAANRSCLPSLFKSTVLPGEERITSPLKIGAGPFRADWNVKVVAFLSAVF